MKVAIVTPTLSHFEVPLFRLAAAIPEFETCVFHMDAKQNAHYDLSYGATIDWGEDLRRGYENRYSHNFSELRSALWSWQPNVVLQYGYSWPGALQLLTEAKFRRVPIVHRGLLSPHFDPRTPRFRRTKRRIRSILLRQFTAHQYGGSHSREALEVAGVSSEKCYFVPFSVDSGHFSALADEQAQSCVARELRASCGWLPDDPVCLFVGQHAWVKGPDLMLQIVERAQSALPDLKLLMIGSGPMTEQLRMDAFKRLLPGSVYFTGYVSSKGMVPWYLLADVAVFPSRYDTWGRAINEAMLCRRPAIVSSMAAAAGGLVDGFDQSFVMTELNPDKFASRLIEFQSLTAERKMAIGEAARRQAQLYSYEAHVEDFKLSLMESVK